MKMWHLTISECRCKQCLKLSYHKLQVRALTSQSWKSVEALTSSALVRSATRSRRKICRFPRLTACPAAAALSPGVPGSRASALGDLAEIAVGRLLLVELMCSLHSDHPLSKSSQVHRASLWHPPLLACRPACTAAGPTSLREEQAGELPLLRHALAICGRGLEGPSCS